MYPRLNPKKNTYRLKAKNFLNIEVENGSQTKIQSFRQNYHSRNTHGNQTINKVKTIVGADQNDDKLERFDRLESKQKSRHSVCVSHLPEKFNHLRGKRRSLQLALMLYQHIQDEKSDLSFQPIQSTKKRDYSSLKLAHDSTQNQNQKKSYFSRAKFTSNSENEQPCSKMSKYQSKYFKDIPAIHPLSQKDEREANVQKPKYLQSKLEQLSGKCQYLQGFEYNFIQKSVKKKSFFKNKIMEHILQNSIDQWHNQDKNDESQIKIHE